MTLGPPLNGCFKLGSLAFSCPCSCQIGTFSSVTMIIQYGELIFPLLCLLGFLSSPFLHTLSH